MAEANADTGAAAAAAAAAAAQTTPWHTGVDAETLGLWQNKGYDLTSPMKVASELTKAYRAAETKLGAPADELVRFPKNPAADTDGMKPIWERLGAPKEAKEYDFPALKDAEGKSVDVDLDTALRNAAFELNMPKGMATKIAEVLMKHQTNLQSAEDAEHVANLKTEQETLAKNWGIHAPANKVIAQNAALALGMTKEDVDALETVVGYARTMELLRNIGTKIGEAKFIRPDGPGGQNIVSREQATARIKELQSDAVWRKAYLDGDKAKLREMTDLTKISVGDDIEGRF